jgi:hypothetical protein
MYARVSTYEVADCERFVAGLVKIVDSLHKLDGFSHAYLLVDRECREAVSITVWESQEALQRSVPIANRIRELGTRPSGADVLTIREYEILGTTPETITPSGHTIPLPLRAPDGAAPPHADGRHLTLVAAGAAAGR